MKLEKGHYLACVVVVVAAVLLAIAALLGNVVAGYLAYDADKVTLKAELQTNRDNVEKLNNVIPQLELLRDTAQRQMIEVSVNVTNETAILAALKEDIRNARIELKEEERKISQTRIENEKFVGTNTMLQALNASVGTLISDRLAELNDLTKRNALLKDGIDDELEKMRAEQERIKNGTAKATLDKKSAESDAAVARSAAETETVNLGKIKAEVAVSEDAKNKVLADLAIARGELAAVRKEITSAIDGRTTAKAEAETARKADEAEAKNLAKTKAEIKEAEDKLRTAHSDLATAYTDLATVNGELAAIRKEITLLEARRNKLVTELPGNDDAAINHAATPER